MCTEELPHALALQDNPTFFLIAVISTAPKEYLLKK